MFEIAEMLGQYLSKGNQSAAEFILNYFPPSTFREHMEPIYDALESTLISNHLDEAQLFLKYFSMSRLSGYQLDEFKKILLRDLILSEHHYVAAIKACLGIDVFEPQVFRGIVYSIDPPDKYLPIETAEFILQNFPPITFEMFEIQDLTNNFINMLSPTPLYEFYTVKFKNPDALASEIQECSQRYTDKVFQAIFPKYLNPRTFSYDNLTISKRFIRAVKDNNLRLAQRILDYFPPSRTDYENHAVAFLFAEVLRKKNLLAAKFLWDHFSTMILHSKYLGDLTDVLVNSLKNGHQFEVAKFILSHFHAVKLPDPLRKIGKALAQTNDPEIVALLKSNLNRPY